MLLGGSRTYPLPKGAVPMARPNFRKRKGSYPWHFCTNCPDWPTSDYDERSTAGDPLCDHCQQLERDGKCS